ncbi:hypothetical protein [Oleiagrimonas sp.]|uniref:hypothetical protein n=1 Tax=Oleiagrimonas sp. TaxID=2010330 RepID=UPI00260E9BD8|nr:hypothetical protein [Oleiagrimonas sp.]MDA3914658.1 hypothetical protein [Oleiagrimonas sp.]
MQTNRRPEHLDRHQCAPVRGVALGLLTLGVGTQGLRRHLATCEGWRLEHAMGALAP